MAFHWIAAEMGPSPGADRLTAAGHEVTFRFPPASAPVGGHVHPEGWLHRDGTAARSSEILPGDVVISSLPLGDHADLALTCIGRHAHLVSAQPASPRLLGLDAAFRAAGLVSLNGVGFVPGLDHLMAHDLVARYRASPGFDAANALSMLSCAGEVPRASDAFRQKFRAPPVADLLSLAAPSVSVRAFTELRVAHPRDATIRYDAPLPLPETFEVHPVGDSRAMLDEFRFDPSWRVRDLMRGRVRLIGWSEAWARVQADLATLPGHADDRVKPLADALWRDHAYAPDEPDRALLFVSMKAEREGRAVFHETWALDAWGDARGPAMARLAQVLLSLAAEAVLAREIPVGVHAAPHDPRLIARWLGETEHLAQHLMRIARPTA